MTSAEGLYEVSSQHRGDYAELLPEQKVRWRAAAKAISIAYRDRKKLDPKAIPKIALLLMVAMEHVTEENASRVRCLIETGTAVELFELLDLVERAQ